MTKTMRRPDNELKDAVVQELRWIPSVNSTHIGVAVNDGAVTLSGEVDSFPEKMLAGRAVERVHGVTAIAQEITVHTATSQVTDTDIAMQAGDAIQRAVDVPETVKVAVHDHIVTLSGSVHWHSTRCRRRPAARSSGISCGGSPRRPPPNSPQRTLRAGPVRGRWR